MTKQRKILYLLSAVLLILVLCLSVLHASQNQNVVLPLSFDVPSGQDWEEIKLWQNEAGEYYAFFPSYTDLSQVRLQTNTTKDFVKMKKA